MLPPWASWAGWSCSGSCGPCGSSSLIGSMRCDYPSPAVSGAGSLGMSAGMTDLRALSPDRLELGEGSRWVGDRVVLVDIPAGRLFGTPASVESGAQELTPLAKIDVPLAAVA